MNLNPSENSSANDRQGGTFLKAKKANLGSILSMSQPPSLFRHLAEYCQILNQIFGDEINLYLASFLALDLECLFVFCFVLFV